MKDLFKEEEVQETIKRINTLTAETNGLWGKMHVSQMLAHCCVAYEMTYENKYPKPNAIKKALLKTFVKKAVVGDKPYPKNGRTAPEFLITDNRDFELERKRLIQYIEKTQKLGAEYFNNKESHSFGKLTKKEWNTMFSKHLDHHLTQFGV